MGYRHCGALAGLEGGSEVFSSSGTAWYLDPSLGRDPLTCHMKNYTGTKQIIRRCH